MKYLAFTFLLVLSGNIVCAEISPLDQARNYAKQHEVDDISLSEGLSHALWNKEKSGVALCFHRTQGTLCLILFKKTDNEFQLIDVSNVELSNFGKLGSPRIRYDRFRTFPKTWKEKDNDLRLPLGNGICQVQFVTQAWIGKQRFTVDEPLIIRQDFTPWWR